MENYILGLDISTSTVGASVFEDLGHKGELVMFTHFDFNSKNLPILPDTQLERLIIKGEACLSWIKEFKKLYNITKVVVEEPLAYASNTPVIGGMLALFNEYLSDKVSKLFNVEVVFVSVRDSRIYGLPELYKKRVTKGKVSKNPSLFGGFPTKVLGKKFSKYKKLVVMYQLCKRFPEIAWELNSVYNINNKNFDRSDSAVVVLAHMSMIGTWENEECDYSDTLDFVKKVIQYEEYSKQLKKDMKGSKRNEQNIVKKAYIVNELKLNENINIEFDGCN